MIKVGCEEAMKRILIALLLAGCASTPQVPSVQGPKLVPNFDWDKDKTLQAFRQQIIEVVRSGDEAGLFGHLDPNVRISFGPGGGITDFKRAWHKKPLWNELRTIFEQGGGSLRGNDHFWAPSVYADWPEKIDAFSYVAVISRDTLLRDANSNPIARLSYDIVKPLGEKGHIRTADGREGYVDPRLLWSPVGYRVGLVRKSGTWKIEALVSGD